MYVYLATFERFQLVSTCKKSLYNFFQRKHKCMRFWQNTKTIFSYTKSSPNQFFMTSAYSDQNSTSSSSHGKIHQKVDVQKSSFPVHLFFLPTVWSITLTHSFKSYIFPVS